MSTTWYDATSTGYEAADIGPLFGHETSGWYDARYFGALLDMRHFSATSVAGSAVLTPTGGNTFLASDGDVGKLCTVQGAGAIVATSTDGSMTTAVSYNANILTSASASFTPAVIGRRITVTGVLGGGTLTALVWGVISPTQLRLTANATTIASGCTYVISDDLYGTVLASSVVNATLDTLASTAVTGANVYVGTDDAAAINLAITTSLLDFPRTKQGSAPSIFIPNAFGIGSPITTTQRVHLIGTGVPGYSRLLAHGATHVRALAANLTAYFRFGPAGSGLGLRGSITSGLKILTDPDASWVAGDVGKGIFVVGAGTQVGSTSQVGLKTTIASVDSATQVTLTAAATSTVVDGTYSWWGSGVSNINDAFWIENMHFLGGAGMRCGVHAIDANGYMLDRVTFSDFRSGYAHYGDGGPANTQYMNISNCSFNNNKIAVKVVVGIPIFSGFTNIDGNDNQVAVRPGPGTIGVDCDGILAPGALNIQAVETNIRADGAGSGSSVHVKSLRSEACPEGLVIAGSGTLGGSGNVIFCSSWSTSNVGGSTCPGLHLMAGAQNTIFAPGYYIPSNINMYGACDATALADTVTIDPQSLMDAGGVSTTTPGAVTTVSIAHGLRATPTRFSAERGDANARGAPAYYVTATSTNVVLNFASALTAATPYTWNWTAGI